MTDTEKPLRVLVCGSREWTDAKKIEARLLQLHRDSVIVHGNARGADRLAASIAWECGLGVEAHPADWKKHGRKAGPIRNSEMLATNPDLVIAFAKNMSGGTWDTVTKARALGIPIEVIFDDREE